MAEIVLEILKCCVKFDQHRPHYKVLSNQFASVLGIAAFSSSSSASKSKSQYSSSEEFISFQNTEFAALFEKSTLKACATSM